MAIAHDGAIRTEMADLVVDKVDVGTTNAAGQLVFETSGSAEVATIVLSNPAFGAASNGSATLLSTTDDTDATGGTVSQFKIVDRDSNVVLTGTVTAIGQGGDIEISSTTIGAGSTVSVTSLTYHAAP
jgi:hypothetical protein